MLRNQDRLRGHPDDLYYPPPEGDYIYFEAPPFQPNAGGFSRVNASWAADAAMFAYARYAQRRMYESEFKSILHAAGFSTVEPIGKCFSDGATAARGFFAGNDRFAILAFRGTEKDTLADKAADAAIALVDEQPLGGKSAGHVHLGFQTYLASVWPEVARLVRTYRAKNPTQEICVTGHSLGAAIATLAFHQLQDVNSSLYN